MQRISNRNSAIGSGWNGERKIRSSPAGRGRRRIAAAERPRKKMVTGTK